ncbi:sigma 54-interacting transcriptional regulator [Puniceicoccus vermicola]|uniref:Sigma-54-dependent Fis family transcriptional regulator n=1 Tax=Puniceicoccus vermicola TaxID=388746 RepID=A0A7X1B0F6_9BACT|nr:sigma-54-dependent Fis family transcriptional regulator [Puniceicoccus vermicola]
MSRPKRRTRLLIADDDSITRRVLSNAFESAGISSELYENGEDLIGSIHDEALVCLLDLNMPGKGGLDCLSEIKETYPMIEVIMLTSVDRAAEALQAIRNGAFDYLTKPFDPNELIHTVQLAMQASQQARENQDLRQAISMPSQILDVKGSSPKMKRVFRLLDRLGGSEDLVLLTGESGTGKTLLAKAIHQKSLRRDAPFVSVSCPSLPRELLESEMFGHEKGAFSGAINRRLGRADLADGGTLFLDEIGDIPLELQAKLLTFIQDKSYFRVGGEKLVHSDVRLVAATNRDLRESVEKGMFREDLYYRLNVLPLEIPPLRERLEDLPDLLEHFVSRFAQRQRVKPPRVDPSVLVKLRQSSWPGNIREFENVVIRALTLREREDILLPEDFDVLSGVKSETQMQDDAGVSSLAGKRLDEIEKAAIEQTLALCGNKKSAAAKMLGIAEKSIYNKVKKYGLETDEGGASS